MPAVLTYLGDGHALQDLAYGYDLVGGQTPPSKASSASTATVPTT
jgi:hypothetical protein